MAESKTTSGAGKRIALFVAAMALGAFLTVVYWPTSYMLDVAETFLHDYTQQHQMIDNYCAILISIPHKLDDSYSYEFCLFGFRKRVTNG